MKFLTIEQLVALHVLVIQGSGGLDGVRDVGRLEAAIAMQRQEVFGKKLYVTVFEKAAAIARSIIGDHPFIDGNKRTAMLAGLTLLEVNNMIFAAEKGELEDFAVQIAVDHLDVAAIAGWFKAHSKTV